MDINDKNQFLQQVYHNLKGSLIKKISTIDIKNIEKDRLDELIKSLSEEGYITYDKKGNLISGNLRGMYYTYNIYKTSESPENFGLIQYDDLRRQSMNILNYICKSTNGFTNTDKLKLHTYGEQIISHVIKLLKEEGYIFIEENEKDILITEKGIAEVIRNQLPRKD
jgi:predicted transcriptional regulator